MTKRASALRKPETKAPKETARSAASLSTMVNEILSAVGIDPETRIAWLALEMHGDMTHNEIMRKAGVDPFTCEIDMRNRGIIERRTDGVLKLKESK